VKLSLSWPLISLAVAIGFSTACGSRSSAKSEAPASAPQELNAPSLARLECLSAGDDWSMYGQNVCNTRSALVSGPINPETVSKLKVKWTFKAAGDISATPAVVDGEIFVPDWGGMLNKIDAQTGKSIWSVSVGALIGIGADAGAGPKDTPAGVVARDTPIVIGDSVIFGVNRGNVNGLGPLAIVAAVDRDTGALKWQTQVDAHPTGHIASSPVYDRGKVYVGVSSGEEFYAGLPVLQHVNYPCCSFRGSVVALDAFTGKLVWKTYTIEDSAYFINGTPSGFSGAAVWSTPTIDRARRSLYVTTGNNYSAPADVTTVPAGDHLESILSLDLETGAIKWARRMTLGDVWNLYIYLTTGPSSGGPDWDFGSSANLFQARIDGVWRDVLGAGQKSGIYWAVDPDTGSDLWNRPVGPGGHLGGIHWGTAVDPRHVYVGVNNDTGTPYTLGGSGPQAGQQTKVGSWAALDPSTGNIQWQVANPAMTAPLLGASVNGPLSAVNGVVFGGSMDAQGTMFAFDGATGAVLWSFQSGATVYGGPAVADGVVYWGNGYPAARIQFGTPGGTLYAFQVGR
jgi:polyvinyl alcohol dehydrogenase (cytochrome)